MGRTRLSTGLSRDSRSHTLSAALISALISGADIIGSTLSWVPVSSSTVDGTAPTHRHSSMSCGCASAYMGCSGGPSAALPWAA